MVGRVLQVFDVLVDGTRHHPDHPHDREGDQAARSFQENSRSASAGSDQTPSYTVSTRQLSPARSEGQ